MQPLPHYDLRRQPLPKSNASLDEIERKLGPRDGRAVGSGLFAHLRVDLGAGPRGRRVIEFEQIQTNFHGITWSDWLELAHKLP